jgi:hypothetical protein
MSNNTDKLRALVESYASATTAFHNAVQKVNWYENERTPTMHWQKMADFEQAHRESIFQEIMALKLNHESAIDRTAERLVRELSLKKPNFVG